MLTINIRLFALYRERLQKSQIHLMVPDGSTVEDVTNQLSQEYPKIGLLIKHTAIAVNEEYADKSQILFQGDEMALLPPVSGGSQES